MRIKIRFEKLEELKFEHYEGVATLDKVVEIEVDAYRLYELIDLIGEDKLMDEIGKNKFMEHFDIKERYDEEE